MKAGDDSGLEPRLSAVLGSLPEVELAWLFGSRARGPVRGESDIDLAVLVAPGAARDPRATLAMLFDRLGRVVPSDRLDLVLLNEAPALLRQRILATGRLLFERSPLARVRFTTRTIQDYQDMEFRREFFYRERVPRLKEGRSDGGSGDLLAQARRAGRLLGEAPGCPASSRRGCAPVPGSATSSSTSTWRSTTASRGARSSRASSKLD